ncbi:MAG: exodeoxyribonuclease VII small subunit [Candidatus Saccharibacteria bacterium]|nr:exodeoxyribonuclease VII small subunit [Candidatus Saccharibacteria bacterium]
MAAAKKDYKTLQAELDTALSELQSGELDIDQAVKLYEQGMQLIKELEKQLKIAENKVKKVQAEFGQE